MRDIIKERLEDYGFCACDLWLSRNGRSAHSSGPDACALYRNMVYTQSARCGKCRKTLEPGNEQDRKGFITCLSLSSYACAACFEKIKAEARKCGRCGAEAGDDWDPPTNARSVVVYFCNPCLNGIADGRRD